MKIKLSALIKEMNHLGHSPATSTNYSFREENGDLWVSRSGIDKSSLSREAFLEHAWEWTHEYGGVILEQLKKLGCSCDWDRTRFTMEPDLSEAVIDSFN